MLLRNDIIISCGSTSIFTMSKGAVDMQLATNIASSLSCDQLFCFSEEVTSSPVTDSSSYLHLKCRLHVTHISGTVNRKHRLNALV